MSNDSGIVKVAIITGIATVAGVTVEHFVGIANWALGSQPVVQAQECEIKRIDGTLGLPEDPFTLKMDFERGSFKASRALTNAKTEGKAHYLCDDDKLFVEVPGTLSGVENPTNVYCIFVADIAGSSTIDGARYLCDYYDIPTNKEVRWRGEVTK